MTQSDRPHGGRWGRLAARLGLTPIATRGRFGRRVRYLAGERNGYLVAISPSHSLNVSSVDVLVRHPRETVRGLRDDLLADPALAASFRRKRRVPRSRRGDLVLGDGGVLMRVTYSLFPPTNARVELVVDGLIEALSKRMRPLDRLCEACGYEREPNIYLANGVPCFYCESCIDRHREDEVELAALWRSIEPDYGRGVQLGLGAAFALGVLFGSLAAVAAILTHGAVQLAVWILIFGLLGFFASAITARGLFGARIVASLLKLPFVLLAALIAFVVANAVATMTLHPAIWNVALLWASSWPAIAAAPKRAGLLATAAATGWLVEVVWMFATIRRKTRMTSITRVDAPADVA